MASYATVKGELQTLQNKKVKVKEIVNLVLSIDNIKSKSKGHLAPVTQSPYDALNENESFQIKNMMQDVGEMYIDFTYQRYLNLKRLLDRLTTSDGHFHIAQAHILSARRRTNGDIYIWDGLRRAVLCALKGIKKMPVFITDHTEFGTVAQRVVEARDFSVFNGRGSETMKKEEVWKADYVAQQPDAVNLGNILNDCDLDVLNVLNNGGHSLGGFATFQSVCKPDLTASLAPEYLVRASKIIQKSFVTDNTVKGYLITGIAKYLKILASFEDECNGKTTKACDVLEDLWDVTDDAMILALRSWIAKGQKTQDGLISPSFTNKHIESAAWHFFDKVMTTDIKDNFHYPTMKKAVLDQLNIDPDAT